ncbi:MAG: HpaII family restriction endonuclease, partial [Prevotellaceae bacterium]|nr:HpaII family restriction endonuclease [Prevotellaceae bacterium]
MISANKGEWSELYVLFKLLGEKKLYDCDVDLNKLKTFYPIVSIIRNELEREKNYTIDSDIVIITEKVKEDKEDEKITEKDKKEIKVSTFRFLEEANKLLDKIKNGERTVKGAFKIPEIEPFMRNINCQKIKAQSTEKADIHIILHDYHTNITSKFGFSIKSDLGNSPTLLNASQATKIRYLLVDGQMDDDTAESINSKSGKAKLQERLKALQDKGCRLE